MSVKNIRFEHTKQRLNERYNINIDVDDYDLMCIISKEGLIIKKKSKNRDTRIIYFKNKYIVVGYNYKSNLINTVLYFSNKYKKLL